MKTEFVFDDIGGKIALTVILCWENVWLDRGAFLCESLDLHCVITVAVHINQKYSFQVFLMKMSGRLTATTVGNRGSTERE
jgi:hypothetical protein